MPLHHAVLALLAAKPAHGYELKGSFDSPMAGVNAWRFPDLHGSVLWLPDRLEVTNATSGLYGGTARFARDPVLARGSIREVDPMRLRIRR